MINSGMRTNRYNVKVREYRETNINDVCVIEVVDTYLALQ